MREELAAAQQRGREKVAQAEQRAAEEKQRLMQLQIMAGGGAGGGNVDPAVQHPPNANKPSFLMEGV